MSKYNFGIVSGFFAPIHCGHLDYFEAAKEKCEELIVIVNNDIQLKAKIGEIILTAADRQRIVSSLKCVNCAVISIDSDESVAKSIELIGKLGDIMNSGLIRRTICFFNSGDRDPKNSNKKEVDVCNLYGISMEYLTMPKIDSSTRIRRYLRGNI